MFGIPTECFHAATDNRHVRERIFSLISAGASSLEADALVVRKNSVDESQRLVERFYPLVVGSVLRTSLSFGQRTRHSQIIVMTDRIPVKRKRRSVEKGIRTEMADPAHQTPYRLLHHDSKSCVGLQVADYICWAIARKYNRGDDTYYDLIRDCIRTEVITRP